MKKYLKNNLLKLLVFVFFVFQLSIVNCQSEKCRECHKVLVDQAVAHPASDDCANCHKGNGSDHPQANIKGFELIMKVPQLCYSCHDPLNTKKTIHPPVEGGECLTCHSPHNSPNKSLLVDFPVSKLCLNCHDLKLEKVQHKPVIDGNCLGCHNPHQSDFAKLLKFEKAELCLQCHDKPKQQLAMKNLHPPFKNNCKACHAPHSSTENHLLSDNAPKLCYNCHNDLPDIFNKSLFQHKALTVKNSCLNCHSPHASDQPKLLIAEQKDLCLSCHNKTYTNKDRTIKNIKQ